MRNTAGEDLGKIEEITLDVEAGTVAYVVWSFVVSSFGGFLASFPCLDDSTNHENGWQIATCYQIAIC